MDNNEDLRKRLFAFANALLAVDMLGYFSDNVQHAIAEAKTEVMRDIGRMLLEALNRY